MGSIRYIKHSDIDKRKWDRCIEDAINKSVYAHSWYLDIVSPGWDALVEEDYLSVFPLTHRTKFGIRYLCQPPFTQQLGVFTRGLLTLEKTDEFLNQARSLYKLIEISLNSMNKTAYDKGVSMRVNMVLDLIPDYSKLKSGYTENLRRNLQKARKAKLEYKKNADIQGIINLFSTHRGTQIRTMGAKELYLLSLLYVACHQRKCGFTAGVRDEYGHVIAGAVFIHLHDRLVFLFSGMNDTGRQTGAMAYLIDSVIREYAGTQCILDFEGSMDPGLARFYGSFGSANSAYPMFISNTLSPVIRGVLKIVRQLK